MKKINLLLLFCFVMPVYTQAQHAAVKTNLLYDATSTINLGVEAGLSTHFTLELSGNYNPWTFANNKSIRHWMLQPELRYWIHERFNGHFFGLHAQTGYMDTSGTPFWGLDKTYSYNGLFGGTGLSYGYQLYLSPHWNLEFTVGAGYCNFSYDKALFPENDKPIAAYNDNYWGITKAGISIVYIIH